MNKHINSQQAEQQPPPNKQAKQQQQPTDVRFSKFPGLAMSIKNSQQKERLMQTIAKAMNKQESSYSDKYVRNLVIKQQPNTNDTKRTGERSSKWPHQKGPPKHHTRFVFKISNTIKEEAAKQCDYLQQKLQIKSAPDQVTMVAVPNNDSSVDNHNDHNDQHDNPDANQ
ncbi:hypothetical protein DERF_005475 [Dermatophagoides farinae]|uniref:Uncharacterized protein n=1 Tax=Dermatophagoides farinae TaxID=6954 RepID=A0A922I4C7_DERFA|nr:hypothetical protein HUG17_3526 [Dermatophagoides farinae]KAH9521851.1 hypothetical protein DERF_005475 [Dermatophagoides farinae]